MIGTIFRLGSEIIEVRIIGTTCLFRTGSYGNAFVSIENLKLNRNGVIKEFPDLKDDENWRIKAMNRFNEKLKTYNTELDRMKYVIEDLKKFGYAPQIMQRQGFRPERLR